MIVKPFLQLFYIVNIVMQKVQFTRNLFVPNYFTVQIFKYQCIKVVGKMYTVVFGLL